MTFANDLSKFSKRVEENADQVVRKVVLEVSKSLILMTPVDTGRARANYVISKGTMNTATTEAVDKIGANTLAKIAAYPVEAGGVYFISNSLPYISALEYGHSAQSPQGMFRVTAARFPEIIEVSVVGL